MVCWQAESLLSTPNLALCRIGKMLKQVQHDKFLLNFQPLQNKYVYLVYTDISLNIIKRTAKKALRLIT